MKTPEYIKLKHLSDDNTPQILLEILKFDISLKIALDMLNNDEWDESLQEYATTLLEEIRYEYSEKWNSSWKYDALLGYAYNITLKYDERYEALNRAFNKIHPQPPELLVAMARCCIAPGKPPISNEEAISLLKQATKTIPYIVGIEFLRGLYR